MPMGSRRNGTDEPYFEAGMRHGREGMDLWAQMGDGVGQTVRLRVALKYIHTAMSETDGEWKVIAQELDLVLYESLEGGREDQEESNMCGSCYCIAETSTTF